MNNKAIEKFAYAVLVGTLLIHAFLFWQERALIAKGYPDFTIFYSAGLMVRQGLGHQLYEPAVQYQVQRSFAPGVEIRLGPLPFNHPPFEALIFAPLTLLSYRAAYVTWDLLNLTMLVAVSLVLRPQIPILGKKSLAFWIAGLLAFFPVFEALLQGQDVVLLLLLEALAFTALKRNSDFLSGCWLGLGVFRFQLVLPLVFVLLAWKRRKVFWGFVAASLCLGVVSVAIIGWEQALRYPEAVLHMERIVEQSSMIPSMPNLRGLLEGWRVSPGTLTVLRWMVLALSPALLAYVIVAPGRNFGREVDLRWSLAIVSAVLVSYHAFSHDLVLLVIPLLVILNTLSEHEFRMRGDLLLFLPVALLLTSPLYVLLWFYWFHLNLIALVLLFWLPLIQLRITADSE